MGTIGWCKYPHDTQTPNYLQHDAQCWFRKHAGLFKQHWPQSMATALKDVHPFFLFPQAFFCQPVKLPFSLYASCPLKDLPKYLDRLHISVPRKENPQTRWRICKMQKKALERRVKGRLCKEVPFSLNNLLLPTFKEQNSWRFMDALQGRGWEKWCGGWTLSKQIHADSHIHSHTVCTRQMMCIWDNHMLHLLACVDVHTLLLAFMEVI